MDGAHPRDQAAPQITPASVARGSSQPFVADPSVKLGTPQPLVQLVEAGTFESRPAPQRSQPAPAATHAGPAEFPAEIRASNAPLVGQPETQPSAAAPLSASVRLRITIDGHINLGSGTIIQCDGRQALIATCGHIFRGFVEGSRIEVNLFEGGEPTVLEGRLVKFEAESDVGLIAIDIDRQLPVVRVARDVQKAQAQEAVVSIGCSGGQPPTVEELVVTEVNPYIGPDNLECTGVPVQGRSGGGLFRTTGELVAICIAADPKRKRGVYAGLLALHELLADAGYAHLFRTTEAAVAAAETPAFDTALPARESSNSDAAQSAAPARSLLDSLTPADADDAQTLPARRDEPAFAFNSTAPTASAGGSPVQLGPDASDAEIVCIIRSRNQPESNSRVVIIHQASPKLLSYLRGEMGTSVSGEAAASLLSHQPPRRTREESVPTMDVSRPTSAAAMDAALRTGQTAMSRKPTLEPTVLTQTPAPRRYVRAR